MAKGKSGLGQVLGVVAAGAAIYSGYGMLGGANSLFGGAMMTGGIMKGVGTLTGDKKLAGMGDTLMLAGGVGGMANNALTAGATATTEGSIANATMDANPQTGIFRGFSGSMPQGADAAPPPASTGESMVNLTEAVERNTANAANIAGKAGMQGTTYQPSSAFNMAEANANAYGNIDKLATKPQGLLGILNTAAEKAPAAMITAGAAGLQAIGTMSATDPLAEQQAKNAAMQRALIANQSNVPLQLDPDDPQYLQKKAAAKAAGQSTVDVRNFAKMWKPNYQTTA